MTLEAVETFAKEYANTIQALGSLSTLMAVVVSLALAYASAKRIKPRIRSVVTTSRIYHSSIPSSPTYVTAEIVNVGTVPVRIPFSFFRWRMPHRPTRWMLVNPLDAYQDDRLVPQRKYPVELQPYSSKSFFISEIEAFKKETARSVQTLGALDRFFFRFAKAFICTDDGGIFRARVSKGVRNEIIALCKSATP